MKLDKILSELKIPVTGKTLAGKKLMMRGISVIYLDEGLPPDVHGIPSDLEAYGRGGFSKGQLWMDGGSSGSASGHPNYIQDGFYWGADYNKKILYVRGRAGTNADLLNSNLELIINTLFPKLPKN